MKVESSVIAAFAACITYATVTSAFALVHGLSAKAVEATIPEQATNVQLVGYSRTTDLLRYNLNGRKCTQSIPFVRACN